MVRWSSNSIVNVLLVHQFLQPIYDRPMCLPNFPVLSELKVYMCVNRITDFFFTQHIGIFLALLILMCGDVHLNSGPIYSDTCTLRVSHFNVRSLISLSSEGTHPADQRYIKCMKLSTVGAKTQIITLSERNMVGYRLYPILI